METLTESEVNSQKPEFGDKRVVHALFGLKEGTLYCLHKRGLVRSASFKVRTDERGKRLYDLNSIRQFLAAQIEQPSKNAEAPLVRTHLPRKRKGRRIELEPTK
jgi:hypothetical protein